MDRHHWSRQISRLDPASDYEQIYRIVVSHEFPWDMNQSLSFALYRTYAVPSIGRLLSRTGEFTQRTQKRYDDTALILDTVLEHGMASPEGRAAVRRMNQMHGALTPSTTGGRRDGNGPWPREHYACADAWCGSCPPVKNRFSPASCGTSAATRKVMTLRGWEPSRQRR